MMGDRLGDKIGLNEETIKKACNLSMDAHIKSPSKPYLCEKVRGSNDIVFAFPGSWSVEGWYSRAPFGEAKINSDLFPCLKGIGTDEVALVNEAFARRFEELLKKPTFEKEVLKAVSDRKQIVFTGHSSGGPIAILANLWFIEKYIRLNNKYNQQSFCMTFGSPLAGNKIFSHALRRENWAKYFIHFVMRYDIVPRIMLSPLSSIEQGLHAILPFLGQKSNGGGITADYVSAFFATVMRNVSMVASHTACNLMGSTNLLLETVSSFIEISPYRPFGTYIFCTGNGKLLVVENPDAVLQLLFYCLQVSSLNDVAHAAQKSLSENLSYGTELYECLEMQDVVELTNLLNIPLSSNASSNNEAVILNSALNDLGLSSRARLCLRAAGEWQKQKLANKKKFDDNMRNIESGLQKIQDYQTLCEIRKLGYYDAFKLQKTNEDFNANITRLELAGIWDEIIEMLKRYELPDEFEGQKDWISLGTRFRRLVEPLDIANYYRHLKDEDTGAYMKRARPKRYRFTQRWLEHDERRLAQSSSESCFWAEVQELKKEPYLNVKEKILALEKQAYDWVNKGLLGKDAFLEESTFTKWQKTFPSNHVLHQRPSVAFPPVKST